MRLTLILALLCLSACVLAQDHVEEHYTLTGDGECDTALTIATDGRLDVLVYDNSEIYLAGTNMYAGDVWDTRLPTGRADYDLVVSHDEGVVWSYDLRVDCPITPAPEDTEEAHDLSEYLTQHGIDPMSGRVVTAIPVRTAIP